MRQFIYCIVGLAVSSICEISNGDSVNVTPYPLVSNTLLKGGRNDLNYGQHYHIEEPLSWPDGHSGSAAADFGMSAVFSSDQSSVALTTTSPNALYPRWGGYLSCDFYIPRGDERFQYISAFAAPSVVMGSAEVAIIRFYNKTGNPYYPEYKEFEIIHQTILTPGTKPHLVFEGTITVTSGDQIAFMFRGNPDFATVNASIVAVTGEVAGFVDFSEVLTGPVEVAGGHDWLTWTTTARNAVPLLFEDLVARYAGFGYDPNGYIDVSPGLENGVLRSKKDGLSSSGFASIILQRLFHQSAWQNSYNRELHLYLGTRLRPEDRHIGLLSFTERNVADADHVFTDGMAERTGLGVPVVLNASDVIDGQWDDLQEARLYLFSVQRWKSTAKGKIVKEAQKVGPPKYIRESQVGFVRPLETSLQQYHYANNYGGGIKLGEFAAWLRSSIYNPTRPINKAQRNNIRVYFFPVPEPITQ
jgi:hypothetical protein